MNILIIWGLYWIDSQFFGIKAKFTESEITRTSYFGQFIVTAENPASVHRRDTLLIAKYVAAQKRDRWER